MKWHLLPIIFPKYDLFQSETGDWEKTVEWDLIWTEKSGHPIQPFILQLYISMQVYAPNSILDTGKTNKIK